MKKITLSTLQSYKQSGHKISCLTAYDASFARLFDEQGIEALLIGDSLGNVVQGQQDTLPVTVDEIAYHTRCVKNGVEHALIIADMPFMSMPNLEDALRNAATLMRAGAHVVKMEGGAWLCDTVKAMVQQGIPVCGHLGLTPQSVHVFGGFKVQGRSETAASRLLADAKALEEAGMQLLVLECVPSPLAKAVTEAVNIPVIGIGAGNDTDGQILVMHDIFGISHGIVPRFAKNFLQETGDIRTAVRRYVDDVQQGRFPDQDHSFAE